MIRFNILKFPIANGGYFLSKTCKKNLIAIKRYKTGMAIWSKSPL